MNSGGYVYDDGTLVDATVNGFGVVSVANSGTTSSTTVSGGGEEFISGIASATTVNSGGLEFVYSGRGATGITLSGGGALVVLTLAGHAERVLNDQHRIDRTREVTNG